MLGHAIHAGAAAAFDLILQAGSRPIAEKIVVALSHLKQLVQQIKTISYRGRGGIRPKILSCFALLSSVKAQLWEFLIRGYMDERIGLIVSESYVVGRSLGFNQILL